jgi:hypothetical protein
MPRTLCHIFASTINELAKCSDYYLSIGFLPKSARRSAFELHSGPGVSGIQVLMDNCLPGRFAEDLANAF